MEFNIPPMLAYIASWLSLTGGVWALFDRAETVASEELKRDVSRWLRNLELAGSGSAWPATFTAIFDRVFGERHLSWRCFLRSGVASVASVLIVTLVWALFRPSEFRLFIDEQVLTNLLFALSVVGLALLINTVPDYLSLLQTRYVLHLMSRQRSLASHAGLLTVDVVATAVLAAAIVLLAASRVSLALGGEPRALASLEKAPAFFVERVLPLTARDGVPVVINVTVSFPASDVKRAAREIESAARRPHAGAVPPAARRDSAAIQVWGIPWGIFFYSAFFTSAWIWIYAVSGSILRLTQALGLAWRRLRSFLDIENKPLRSIGMVANLLITLAYVVMPFVR